MDIHAGEGGEDSRLFARDLLAAYLKYAARFALGAEVVYESQSAWSVRVTGHGCWEKFRHEAGKHVVQRIPPTESKGRRHTSVVAVAVLPLMRQEKCTLSIEEIVVSTQRGHGRGGQNQNKVESAVRVVHKPTGITVFINGRDQYRNKQIALEILQARVFEQRRAEANQRHNQDKLEQLGYGQRSGKLRTYNFINSVVIDHRTGRKTHNVSEVMRGGFDMLK